MGQVVNQVGYKCHQKNTAEIILIMIHRLVCYPLGIFLLFRLCLERLNLLVRVLRILSILFRLWLRLLLVWSLLVDSNSLLLEEDLRWCLEGAQA